MKTTDVRSCIVSLLTAVVLLIQGSPVLAGEPPHAQLAVRQGSSVPGVQVPSTETAKNTNRAPVEITFTKWITTYPELAGFVGGDVTGDFAGEVLNFVTTTNASISSVEAVYEVHAQAGHRSFAALIRGGQNNDAKTAILDGVILAGWRTGDRVHVEFKVLTDCAGAPTGTCFQGTIQIERTAEK
jgi:hypothetical protein